MAEERFATKEEILKNLKKQYKQHRITYKQYMVELHRTEKHYDEWLAEYEKSQGNDSGEYDMTNEELAIGKRMSELQEKQTPVEATDSEEVVPESENVNPDEENVHEEVKTEENGEEL